MLFYTVTLEEWGCFCLCNTFNSLAGMSLKIGKAVPAIWMSLQVEDPDHGFQVDRTVDMRKEGVCGNAGRRSSTGWRLPLQVRFKAIGLDHEQE